MVTLFKLRLFNLIVEPLQSVIWTSEIFKLLLDRKKMQLPSFAEFLSQLIFSRIFKLISLSDLTYITPKFFAEAATILIFDITILSGPLMKKTAPFIFYKKQNYCINGTASLNIPNFRLFFIDSIPYFKYNRTTHSSKIQGFNCKHQKTTCIRQKPTASAKKATASARNQLHPPEKQ